MATLQPKKLTVALPEDLHKKLKLQSKREGRIMQRVVEEILLEGLKRRATA